MALAYTAPTWTDGSGEGISASNLQAISNCIEGLVQGSDKAVHGVQINGSTITLVYADGTQESFSAVDIKGIASVEKTATAGLIDTYTITYSDGTTDTFSVTNGEPGTYPDITASATADATSSANPTVTVTKTGDDDAPNFAFAFSGLKGAQGEQGPTGADGQDGQDGVSPEVTITTITGGHRITITDADHPSGQSFDVLDGSGAGDMTKAVYDSNDTVANAGGISAFVTGLINALATVARTGAYSYLTGLPTIPTVNNGTLTIQQNGTTKGRFDANQSRSDTINIVTDEWSTSAQVSSGSVSFTIPSNTFGYDLYCERPNVSVTNVAVNGTTVTYTLSGAQNGDNCKLRILK
jgi:hypothetical protein